MDGEMLEKPGDSEEHDMAILRSHTAQLMEHFDTVQIFVTRQNNESDTTMTANYGAGNWYARFGQTREWITREEERARLNVSED